MGKNQSPSSYITDNNYLFIMSFHFTQETKQISDNRTERRHLLPNHVQLYSQRQIDISVVITQYYLGTISTEDSYVRR